MYGIIMFKKDLKLELDSLKMVKDMMYACIKLLNTGSGLV